MKIIHHQEYGNPSVLKLNEVPKPSPKANEVLVKIMAASVNSWDWDMLIGKPFLVRLDGGLFRPKRVLGVDIAGRVEEVGEQVVDFKVGDEVFGDISGVGWGGFAEYVCVNPNPLAIKSTKMTFEEAASIPQAGVLALQGLKFGKGLQKGDKLLINGAGGGVGTFAIQMAKHIGAEITVVDRGDKLGLLPSLGADHLIDYTKEDFTKSGKTYDFILDMVANRKLSNYYNALNPNGTYVMVGGKTSTIFSVLLGGMFGSLFSKKTLGILVHRPNRADLEILKKKFDAGTLVPKIDSIYALQTVPEALQKIGKGDVKGKLIIKIHG